MSLFKRRVTRRAAGVGVGVALLMLGLEAPAFAAPAITGFSPTSGPVGCTVVVTGTDFANPDVTSVQFGGVPATGTADFVVVSDTEIWAAVPTGAVDGFITVTKSSTSETATSAPAAFDVTTDAGGCAPTVTSFTPICGTVGTTVAITGTNLISHTGTGVTSVFKGATVEFSPFDAAGAGQPATHTGQAETATSLSVNVPATADTGRLQVTTAIDAPGTVVGNVFTTDEFQVVTDLADCVAGPGPTHARSITLTLKRHLRARGVVSLTDSTDTTTECFAGVPVKIQRRVSGHWKNVGSTTTNDNGAYKRRIKDKAGRYRALAPKVTLASGDVCSKAVSPTRKHRH